MTRKKKKRKIKYGQITLEILGIIGEIAEELADAFFDQQEMRRKIRSNDFASVRLFDYLKNINNSDYIEIKTKTDEKKNKFYSIKLTNKGQLKLLENSNEQKIDGKWRLLSFDVPEELTSQRNSFRCALKRIGFRQVQKSLWACPFSKADKVALAVEYYKLNQYVAYFIVAKTDIESHLKLLFRDVLAKKTP
ncbi:MAG: Uncharacterized protein CEN92_424 [Candidatus Berkelbacteria bacterium Licking1014_96]|uniref:Transcriptional repressor PaaX-like central Cas2-like domain-containing protein n=1 Tax=Candidatus Berkelbacteria bacterium Licking1014_96 TaxID=2017149 RepID=A0A554LCR1_9BACT|nr:MAG: Uncharacterized protein CEN92_424 [Candidatus Berkelbacteria bacterium Licking1014_96]